MRKRIFKILIGLPASGKSTFSELMEKNGYKVFSSDRYREEKGYTDNTVLFDVLYRDAVNALKNGFNVVLDATNIGRKHRRGLISQVRGALKDNVSIECELFIVPLPVLKARNCKRANRHGVTDEVIEKMFRQFEAPWYGEGFDRITVHADDYSDMKEDAVLGYTEDDLLTMDQDNPHHTMTVGRHEQAAVKALEKDPERDFEYALAVTAAKYHDDGKFFTKTFLNMHGERTDTAHFYRHENAGAYLFLVRAFCLKQFEEINDYVYFSRDLLLISNLIGLHMRPLTAWKYSEKARKKDEELLGDEFKLLVALNKADVSAH